MKLIINKKAELKIRIAMKHAKNYEIMWFGILKRTKTNNFILKDILFPPQYNQYHYVETDDEKFPKWMFNNVTKKNLTKQVRLHGHTHPRFATQPSPTDMAHMKRFMKAAGDHYIQMILSNTHKPYCVYHEIDPETEVIKSQNISIIWNYTLKIKRVLIDKMQIQKSTRPSYNKLMEEQENESK